MKRFRAYAGTAVFSGRAMSRALRWALIAAGLCLIAATLGADVRNLRAADAGWLKLVPVESFKGWTRVAIPPDKALDPVSQWKLDKARHFIICEGDHGHEWLRYDREFANFIFHVEWRFTKGEGLKGYNSGVFVRNNATGAFGTRHKWGPEMMDFCSARHCLTAKSRASSLVLSRR